MVWVVFWSFMARVAVGGTFEFLHRGHQRLLVRSCELAGSSGEVVVGVTSDEFASRRGRCVEGFDVRAGRVWEFLSHCGVRFSVVKLEDVFGPALWEDFDYIVVSPETYSTAVLLNGERRRRGLSEIEVVCVDFVLADDGLPISSSRIASGEIDEQGCVHHD